MYSPSSRSLHSLAGKSPTGNMPRGALYRTPTEQTDLTALAFQGLRRRQLSFHPNGPCLPAGRLPTLPRTSPRCSRPLLALACQRHDTNQRVPGGDPRQRAGTDRYIWINPNLAGVPPTADRRDRGPWAGGLWFGRKLQNGPTLQLDGSRGGGDGWRQEGAHWSSASTQALGGGGARCPPGGSQAGEGGTAPSGRSADAAGRGGGPSAARGSDPAVPGTAAASPQSARPSSPSTARGRAAAGGRARRAWSLKDVLDEPPPGERGEFYEGYWG